MYVGKDKKSGLSANEIGARVGITGAQVMNYVKGNAGVTHARMVQLADAMRITNDELRRYGCAPVAEERERRPAEPPRGGFLLPRMIRLRDELDALIGDVRERGL